MSKTFSKCQDCQRMEYIVDGGTVCESCLRHTTQAKVLLSHADSEIETLRTQLTAANERVKEAEEFANTAAISVSQAQERIEQLTERAERAEKELADVPRTADGCIAKYGDTYWYWDRINCINQPTKYGWTERVLESCAPHEAEYSWTTSPELCWSSLEKAQESRKQGGCDGNGC